MPKRWKWTTSKYNKMETKLLMKMLKDVESKNSQNRGRRWKSSSTRKEKGNRRKRKRDKSNWLRMLS